MPKIESFVYKHLGWHLMNRKVKKNKKCLNPCYWVVLRLFKKLSIANSNEISFDKYP